METKGLVTREGCEGDKRGTFAVLTDQGLDTIGTVAPSHVASVREHFVDQLKPAELTALTEAYLPVLEKLRVIRDRD
jgi:DNA-binding MarR family transcriptional regulator